MMFPSAGVYWFAHHRPGARILAALCRTHETQRDDNDPFIRNVKCMIFRAI